VHEPAAALAAGLSLSVSSLIFAAGHEYAAAIVTGTVSVILILIPLSRKVHDRGRYRKNSPGTRPQAGRQAGRRAGGGAVTVCHYAWGCAGAGGSGGSSGPVSYGGNSGGYVVPGGAVYGYAAGGSSGPVSPPQGTPGAPGFDGAGSFDLAAGSVLGARWWQLPGPDLTRSPLDADRDWPRRLLCGQRDTWIPGLNEAQCLAGCSHGVPDVRCGCGFWAYWQFQQHDLGGGLTVAGIIEGTGRTLIGERGFRCQQARIVALHLPFITMPERRGSTDRWSASWNAAFTRPGTHRPPAGPPPASALKRARTGGTAAERLAEAYLDLVAEDAGQAWMAVIGDRLEQMYPGARVFETREAMLRAFPPDTSYMPPPEQSHCQWCGRPGTAAETRAHVYRCGLRLP
jgi:hypothetical protein